MEVRHHCEVALLVGEHEHVVLLGRLVVSDGPSIVAADAFEVLDCLAVSALQLKVFEHIHLDDPLVFLAFSFATLPHDFFDFPDLGFALGSEEFDGGILDLDFFIVIVALPLLDQGRFGYVNEIEDVRGRFREEVRGWHGFAHGNKHIAIAFHLVAAGDLEGVGVGLSRHRDRLGNAGDLLLILVVHAEDVDDGVLLHDVMGVYDVLSVDHPLASLDAVRLEEGIFSDLEGPFVLLTGLRSHQALAQEHALLQREGVFEAVFLGIAS
mmetsp:Transcript_28541/g.43145  ORF Transcript_28541/g.43145 Transcript_28541/m.43145 type:complete len:267 (-) Transcript_28541:380-1180(-)